MDVERPDMELVGHIEYHKGQSLIKFLSINATLLQQSSDYFVTGCAEIVIVQKSISDCTS